MTRTARTAVLTAALALLVAAPARQGKKVWWISTMVPTICLPTNRVGARTISGAEIFTPPGYEIVGKKVTFEDLRDPALYYNDVTKHYEVTLRPGPKGKLTGDLHLTFSFIIPTYPMPSMIIYGCVGKAKFTAKPVK
jgi:hypothetical protein